MGVMIDLTEIERWIIETFEPYIRDENGASIIEQIPMTNVENANNTLGKYGKGKISGLPGDWEVRISVPVSKIAEFYGHIIGDKSLSYEDKLNKMIDFDESARLGHGWFFKMFKEKHLI